MFTQFTNILRLLASGWHVNWIQCPSIQQAEILNATHSLDITQETTLQTVGRVNIHRNTICKYC